MSVKGHSPAVHNWSDAIDLKLRAAVANCATEVQDQFVLSVSVSAHLRRRRASSDEGASQVYQVIMSMSDRFDEVGAEFVRSGCLPPKTNDELKPRAETDPEVAEVSKELSRHIKEVKQLNKIRPGKTSRRLWSLLSMTAWTTSNHNSAALKGMCAVALEEAGDGVLGARQRSLNSELIMKLRFAIWMEANLWLRLRGVGVFGSHPEFQWWDGCVDQVTSSRMVYEGEMAGKISALMSEDIRDLKELGDLLTRSRALANNRDRLASQRVISSEAKAAIDTLLKVSRPTLNTINR